MGSDDSGRGSIAFFGTYRPPVPLDIYSCPADPPPSSREDEHHLTDGVSYNQNGRAIPAAALKELLTFLGKKNPALAAECGATPDDAEQGRVAGLVFVSERDKGLETLHVALVRPKGEGGAVKVLSLGDVYGAGTFGGSRMEDSGCVAGGFKVGARAVGHSLVYVSTKEPVTRRRTPWTVVYRTNLADGKTERLTPPGQYDVSPAVSPSGKMVAVANFRGNKWTGEIERLNTDIAVMNVDRTAQGGLRRRILIRDGGWPTWGSDNVIFFHRGTGESPTNWAVFRYDMATKETVRVTPEAIDAMTPAAISETRVAVAAIRQKSRQAAMTTPREEAQYRHIEIFDVASPDRPAVQISQKIRPKGDHYNPFVADGGSRIGYHRVRTDDLVIGNNLSAPNKSFDKMHSPHTDVGLFRVSGVFPTISKDGAKLAFVDNEFKAVWLADTQGLRVVYEKRGSNSVFSTAWNQNPDKDTLYVCVGPSFSAAKPLEIYAISNVSGPSAGRKVQRLTAGNFNNAFPSSNAQGDKFVFRSTRDGGKDKFHKNLYIMEDAEEGEFGQGTVTRLTDGPWTDTHCSWSPKGDWVVFSSTREMPASAPGMAFLDAGYFAVYLVKVSDPTVVVRVVQSSATLAGHVNHPIFSPDMRSIVFASDLAAVSNEPISMPVFLHSVRPYGDILSVDLRDTDDITKNKDIQEFHRITHSRYEYSTPTWTKFATDDPNEQWNMLAAKGSTPFRPACPYMYPDGGEGWHMAGHLTIPKRCC
ncbi:unnamed protein product [Triticum turgidum subsp. durum]|uniref:Uncharacterized protein n=1 Tax=Triticum turgidum subsp. durum TaxID=4567 RepID=A0A9R0ST56_TRITD|nr:unnamed protein product [Triticum turgidum subsp. durum]